MKPDDPRYNCLIVTNIPGANWDESCTDSFVERFQQKLNTDPGTVTKVFSIREMIYNLARAENIFLDPNRIHRSSDDKVRLLRRLAFQQVEQCLLEDGANPVPRVTVVETRATSYSSHGKEESLASRYLKCIRPNLLVVVIDDPVAIYNRIPKRDDTRKYGSLGVDDIVWWQELEVSEMERLSQELSCPLFVIPRQQVGALVDLIMTDKQTAYASYPMTKVDKDEEEKIKKFVSRLKERFVVFDPACMGTAHIEMRMTDKEWVAYRQNIVKRDREWFIRINSKYVVVYLPAEMPAHGSQSELVAGSEQGKTVWVVLEPEYSDEHGKLTPFLDMLVDHVFISSEEFEYFLGLSQDERIAYGFLVDLKWRFKWRGELAGLKHTKLRSSGSEKTEEQTFGKFSEEVAAKYQREVDRRMLPSLDGAALGPLVQACWRFDQPLWKVGAPKIERIELFTEPEAEVLAARSTPSGPDIRSEGPVEQISFNGLKSVPDQTSRLSDEEVFAAIFGGYPSRKGRKLLFETLHSFFGESELGSFESNVGFLRFVERTLDNRGYKSLNFLKVEDIRKWFREFSAGEPPGSPQR